MNSKSLPLLTLLNRSWRRSEGLTFSKTHLRLGSRTVVFSSCTGINGRGRDDVVCRNIRTGLLYSNNAVFIFVLGAPLAAGPAGTAQFLINQACIFLGLVTAAGQCAGAESRQISVAGFGIGS